MATGPRCFKCRYDMPSEPVDPVDFVLSITVFGHVGGERKRWFKDMSYSPVCSVYFSACGVEWES